ncbi:MAG: hypothetical protein JOZ58_21815 [Acetobacteraceae bacterium]|nr:hypothetical protein [Acetobacteraceae bacterium]
MRSLLLIGFGLAMLLCALLIRPTQEFDPDIPTGLDDDERFALIGILALDAGFGTTLVCTIAWIAARTRSAVSGAPYTPRPGSGRSLQPPPDRQ